MASDAQTILLTSADIDNIQQERDRINAEISAIEKNLPQLHARSNDLTDRLAKINSLLEALGLSSIQETSSNSLYASRQVRTVPRGNGNGTGTGV